MMGKKGVGAVIAWVLLLGFTVALATTVFLWMKSQTETMGESTVEYVEGEMQCQNVRVNVLKTSDPPTCESLDVLNKGYVTINQLAVRTFNPEGSTLYPQNPPDYLRPQSTTCTTPCGETSVTGCSGCTKIEVMPIIQIQNRQVGCKDRIILVECS